MEEESFPENLSREEYRNESRKWLMNYEPFIKADWNPSSTMKDEYLTPDKEKKYHYEGIRKELLRSRFLAEIAKEILEERKQPIEVENYCTHYSEKFHVPGFRVKDEPPKNTEAHKKYPLYQSSPLTFWRDCLEAEPRGVTRLAGTTKVNNPLNPFSRNDSFSKPLDLRLDDPEL